MMEWMEWEDMWTIQQILVFVFTGLNVSLNIGMLYFLYRAWNELRAQNFTHDVLADVLARMDKIAVEHATGLFDTIEKCSNKVMDRVELIRRRQNTTAKLIFDDRERLKEHVERVRKLETIAKAIEARFLREGYDGPSSEP